MLSATVHDLVTFSNPRDCCTLRYERLFYQARMERYAYLRPLLCEGVLYLQESVVLFKSLTVQ
jgi:hypothetical protein